MDLVIDTFTDADSTSLDQHTPELGGPWSILQGGTFLIQSGGLVVSRAGGPLYQLASLDGTQPDGTLSVDYTMPMSQEPALLLFRLSDDKNYYYVRLTIGSVNVVRVFRGFPSQLGYHLNTWGVGTTQRAQVVLDSDSITVRVYDVNTDGTTGDLRVEMTFTGQSFNANATQVGLGGAGNNDTGALDNFSFTA